MLRFAAAAEGTMAILTEGLCGFGLDLLLGDPEWLRKIHPVVLMGKCITALEQVLRGCFPRTQAGERAAGMLLAVLMAVGTWAFSAAVLLAAERIWKPAAWGLETIWCWQCLAVRDLKTEALRVRTALDEDGPEAARKAVSRIVGRDTAELSREAVIRAAVETVAENFSDGIVAPMLYFFLGGAPLALCYKAINTMDSMLGYKNKAYLWFGRAAAKLDDAANFVPSRLSAVILILAAGLCREDAAQALAVWRRDRRKHESPNSGQCEAAMAGALQLTLCGPAYYFGELHSKPWIGDGIRTPEPEDIVRACRMETAGSFLALALSAAVRLAGLICTGWGIP